MGSSDRKRRYRRRCAAGRICLRIEIDECRLAEALIRAERLDPEQTADRTAVAAAVAELVDEWVEHWPAIYRS